MTQSRARRWFLLPAALGLAAAACAGPVPEGMPAEEDRDSGGADAHVATPRPGDVTTLPAAPPSAPSGLASLMVYIATPDDVTLCPAELLVVDPEGRRVGVDPATGAVLREVPGAAYDEEGIGAEARNPCGHDENILDARERIRVERPVAGEWEFRVTGHRPGRYALLIDLEPADWRERGRRIETEEQSIETGQSRVHRIRIE